MNSQKENTYYLLINKCCVSRMPHKMTQMIIIRFCTSARNILNRTHKKKKKPVFKYFLNESQN